MRIGVTGGTGFIGRWLLRDLDVSEDFEVVALTRTLGREIPSQRIEWVHGDLSSPADCKRFVSGVDTVIHLAHVNAPLTSNRDLPSDAAANLVPALNLLQAIRDEGRRTHIVFASSGGALYRDRPGSRPFTEEAAIEPATAYGIVKAATESYLRMASLEGWATATVLRIGNAYGAPLPRERLQGFIGVAVTEIAEGHPVRIFGNPENVRDYVHLDDICNAMRLALRPLSPIAVYNIGSGRGTSVREVIELLHKLSPKPFAVEEDPSEQEAAARLPSWAVLDVSRAENELGWTPRVDLRSGLQRLLDSGIL
jgi:UDP-glucose 4-epimerase